MLEIFCAHSEGGLVEHLVWKFRLAERLIIATDDEIRENDLGNKAESLGCCLRRSPSTDVWAAYHGCYLVYETLDCSGSSAALIH